MRDDFERSPQIELGPEKVLMVHFREMTTSRNRTGGRRWSKRCAHLPAQDDQVGTQDSHESSEAGTATGLIISPGTSVSVILQRLRRFGPGADHQFAEADHVSTFTSRASHRHRQQRPSEGPQRRGGSAAEPEQ